MKHEGGCHCKEFSFKSDIDPMLLYSVIAKVAGVLLGQ